MFCTESKPLITEIIHTKEQFDEQVIDSAFKKINQTKNKDMNMHFVYAGQYYYTALGTSDYNPEARLKSFILKGMKKFKIRKIMVSMIHMFRWNLITKEKMENFCKGNDQNRPNLKESVNDDLESLIKDIRLGDEPNDEVETYFLPKLTNEESKLAETKFSKQWQLRDNLMETFLHGTDADVDETEMAASESDSKFVFGECWRKTFTIKNPLKRKISN